MLPSFCNPCRNSFALFLQGRANARESKQLLTDESMDLNVFASIFNFTFLLFKRTLSFNHKIPNNFVSEDSKESSPNFVSNSFKLDPNCCKSKLKWLKILIDL